jgi:UDP-N-acetylmuramate dehydrogenase
MAFPCFSCQFRERISLASIGYYAIGGEARWLLYPASISELVTALEQCRIHALPVIIAGKGSNMLFSDEGFPGAVISLNTMNRMFQISDGLFFCEAGVENTDVATRLLKAGRSGGEWLYRLPGTIGATVRMNGRCYGQEISAVTESVVTVGLDGAIRWRKRDEVFLGYKQTSLMRSPEIVAGAILEFLQKDTPDAIEKRMLEYGDDRDSKHQFDYPSCGSVFKNSYEAGRPSGQIFDALGFRGHREGGAQVSDHHANFIFNTGGARAEDVLRLAAAMRTEAMEKARVSLDLELQCAGLFKVSLLQACGIACTQEPSRPGYAWAGLMPVSENGESSFPHGLLSAPLMDYFCCDNNFPSGIMVRIEQLISLEEAKRTPERPFIRWTTVDSTGNAFFLKPDIPEGTCMDCLWENSVAELFIGNANGGNQYLEFEMTPEGQWLALRFDGRRQRSPDHEHPSEALWCGLITRFSGKEGFGMELTYALLEPFIASNLLSLQCCASLGNGRYGQFPLRHGTDQPDFHQPETFCLVRLV